MSLVSFCLIVPRIMPSSVEFSVVISVAFYGWPVSLRVALSASSSLELYNNDPHSVSAADDINFRVMVDMTTIAPFGQLISAFAPPM